METRSAHKRKMEEAETTNEQKTVHKSRKQEPGIETEREYKTNNDFLALLIHTKAEDLRPPENKVFIAERTDKVVDVFQGLIKHNFLSVPVLQKTKHKYYGFLDMMDIVQYIVSTFGEHKLTGSDDFWKLVATEEEFQTKTVNDVMRYPLTRRNPFNPVRAGFSLFSAIEALAKDPNLHRVAVIDQERNLMNLITQSQVVEFLHKNLDNIGNKINKPIGDVAGVLKPVLGVSHDQLAIDAFNLMVKENVSGVAVLSSDGKLTDNISLRDLKTISADARLFWRLYQKVENFMQKLKKDYHDLHKRPRGVQTVHVNNTLGEVIEKLSEHKIHRVFVVDEEKRPIGIVALQDVLFEIVSE